MKKIKSIALALILILLSCCDNVIEYKKNDCPPIDIVSYSPYNNPIWHPNGKLIGFNYVPLDSITYPYGKECMGKQYINYKKAGFWLINSDGTNQRRILQYQLQSAVWSPDGKWIAFVSGAQIYKMPFDGVNFDTTSVVKLTDTGRNYFPSWRPDGQWITYDSNKDSPNGMNFVWEMKSDGTQKRRILYEPQFGEIRMPSYSREATKIVLIRYKETPSSELHIIDRSGLNSKRITNNNVFDSYPRFYSEGRIVFWSDNSICIIDTTGKNYKQLTPKGVGASFGLPFSVSPNEEEIAYTKYNSDDWTFTNGTLWMLNIKTNQNRQLTFN
ncbi:MAG: hypothetical protein FD143_412 [Ignavibacteria bacterium]|nr:MAG: hypothetical protein FD143_412 [Ignavibacteria bacterium]KAF0160346.1 MAG: hypothetical protein FD188_1848 [Ignavibacteria bacterium]